MEQHCLVVVADDNQDAADSLAILIESLGYGVRAAYDGHEAVQACLRWGPRVAILDVQMPRLDGCEAARLMRGAPRPPALIASLTALSREDEPMKSSSGVFDVHLAKPPRLDEIRAVLAVALGEPPRP